MSSLAVVMIAMSVIFVPMNMRLTVVMDMKVLTMLVIMGMHVTIAMRMLQYIFMPVRRSLHVTMLQDRRQFCKVRPELR